MQKYPHITELFTRSQKILAIMFLFPINFNLFRNMFNTKTIEINNFTISVTK